MTNIENDTPVEDGATEDTATAAPAAQTQDESAKLAEQIAALQQDLLYARAETQNVTRRKDKEIADAHAYASTKFARDILSVADLELPCSSIVSIRIVPMRSIFFSSARFFSRSGSMKV